MSAPGLNSNPLTGTPEPAQPAGRVDSISLCDLCDLCVDRFFVIFVPFVIASRRLRIAARV